VLGLSTQIVVGQLLVAAASGPLLPNGSLSSTFVFLLSMADTVLLVGLILALLRRRGSIPRTCFGRRPPLGEIRAGILSLPFVLGVMVALMLTFAASCRRCTTSPTTARSMIGGFNLWIFLAVVIGAELCLCAGQLTAHLLHRFRGELGQPWMGLFITSLAFGMGHTLQGNDAAIITGALGAIWGAMYLTRGSALAGVVSHALFNSSEVLRVFLT
jgi:membrane protease YdiL (CAAX protease family)